MTVRNALAGLVPSTFKSRIKEQAANLFGFRWNRFGLPISLAEALNKGKPITLIDVGASAGHFTAATREYCGIKKCLMIEPLPERMEELRARFLGNEFFFADAAASSSTGTADMDILNFDETSSLLDIRRDFPGVAEAVDIGVRDKIEVRVAPLDELCREFGIRDDVDLLKIDVQGFEREVVLGATETLQRTRLIWIELNLQELYLGCSTIEGMIRLLSERGFLLRALENGFASSRGELLQVDALFSRPLAQGLISNPVRTIADHRR
jgi:FkbM family methyltransferase